MSLHQSQHELARVSRSSDYITSKDIHDFPNFVNDGDILIYKKDKNGTRWMAGPAPEYVNLIHNNTQTILDLSSNSYLENKEEVLPYCDLKKLIDKPEGIVVLSGSLENIA